MGARFDTWLVIALTACCLTSACGSQPATLGDRDAATDHDANTSELGCVAWFDTEASASIRCTGAREVVVAHNDEVCDVRSIDGDATSLDCDTGGAVVFAASDSTCAMDESCSGEASLHCQGQSVTWDAGLSCDCIAEIAAGQHICVRLTSGAVRCWGFNFSGQLGVGHTERLGDELGELGGYLSDVELGTGRTAVAISAGPEGSCAVLDDATLKCWGDWHDGGGWGARTRLGDEPGEMGDALPLIDLGTGAVVTQVAQGPSTTCVILEGGQVKCWGRNLLGQLGIGLLDADGYRGDGPGEMGDALPAVPLGVGRRAVMVAVGQYHQCALLDSGEVKCWGENSVEVHSPLGLGDTELRGDDLAEMGDALPAVDLGTGETAVSIAAGAHHTCALLASGRVKCWGDNYGGQLGLGDIRPRGGAPGEMGDALPAVDLGGGTVVQLTAGTHHTCALFDDGQVTCWGANAYGQLGRGDDETIGDGCLGNQDVRDCAVSVAEMGSALELVDLGAGKRATSIHATPSLYSTCALLSDGEMRCWGSNFAGMIRVPPNGVYSDDDIGDEPGEMGDALPTIPLGLICDPS